MDAFVTAAAETAIERAQTGVSSSVRVEIAAHLDDATSPCANQIARLLGKEQSLTKRIPCRPIDAVEPTERTNRGDWCQKRDAMIGTRHIKIDSRDISEISSS